MSRGSVDSRAEACRSDGVKPRSSRVDATGDFGSLHVICLIVRQTLIEGEKLGRRRTARGSATVWRRLGIAAAIAALPLAVADTASAQRSVQRPGVHQERHRRGLPRASPPFRHQRPPGPRSTCLPTRASSPTAGLPALQGRRVPQHDPATSARRLPADGVREVLRRRGRLPRHRLGDRDRARLAVLHGHRAPAPTGQTEAVPGDDQGRRPRSMPQAARCCRSTGTRTDQLVQLRRQRARQSRTSSPRSTRRPYRRAATR